MKRVLFALIFLPLLAQSQKRSKIDSVVIQFLKSQPNTSTPILTISGNKKKGIISRNYFWDENNRSVFKDSIKIITYLFGSGVSHTRAYLLIDIIIKKQDNYHIVECPKVEDGIKELLNLIQAYNLSDSQKAVLLHQLTVAYY